MTRRLQISCLGASVRGNSDGVYLRASARGRDLDRERTSRLPRYQREEAHARLNIPPRLFSQLLESAYLTL